MEDSEPWETAATLRGNIIIQISIKIQFKSYLLIEYIQVTLFVVSHLFQKRGKGVLNYLNAWWSLSVLFRLALSSPGLDTSRLGPVLGALHYSKPVLWLRLGGLSPKKPRVGSRLPATARPGLRDWVCRASGHLSRIWSQEQMQIRLFIRGQL